MTVQDMAADASAARAGVRERPLRRGGVTMRALIAAVVLAFSLVAATSAAAHGVGPAGVSVDVAPFDMQFIDSIAAHHRMQIEMGEMAMKRARHPELRTLAGRIVADQRKELAELSKLRKRWYGDGRFREWPMDELQMRMMGMGPNMMEGLMMTKRFDYDWISAVIPHHAAAITLARWETQAGEQRALRLIAKDIIRKQAREVGELIALRQRWYG